MALQRIQHHRRWLVAYLVFATLYFTWRLCFTIPLQSGWLSFFFGALLFLGEGMSLFEFFVHFMNMSQVYVPQKPNLPNDSFYPDVDVFIATYNEPIALLYKTIVGAKHLDYPNPERVHLYLLDDGRRDEAKQLCEQLGIQYITRDHNEFAKAGNINNALKQTTSPYIVTFDADMIPRHEFLMETIPYFMHNEAVRKKEARQQLPSEQQTAPLGFVQTPQAFYNPDVFQCQLFAEHTIPNEQDYFYRSVQLGKNRSNSVIYAGSNTVISRHALDTIGGFVTGIITEDIATGLNIQKAGFKSFALPTVLASGLAPDDLEGLVKQRKRWGRGCIQTFQRFNPLWDKDLTWLQRLNYADSLCYWYSPFRRFMFFLAPILFTVFGIHVVDATLWEVLLFWLPIFFLMKVAFNLLSGGIRNATWTGIYETILMPSLMSAVFFETIGFQKKVFEVTRKDRVRTWGKCEKLQFVIPHLILTVLTMVGFMVAVTALRTPQWQAYLMVTVWLIINLYSLLMTLFFVLGRTFYRQHERVTLSGDVFLQDEAGTELEAGKLLDLSETGIAFFMKRPHYFLGKTYRLQVRTEGYELSLCGTLWKVERVDRGYRYVFQQEATTSSAREQLVQCLYDREPALPSRLIKSSALYHLVHNIGARVSSAPVYRRTTPRVPIRKYCKCVAPSGNQTQWIHDVNYHYVTIQDRRCFPFLDFSLGTATLKTQFEQTKRRYGKSYHLYRVLNAEVLIETPDWERCF